MKVGRLTLSDRAANGIYEDKSGPEIEAVVKEFFAEELEFIAEILPDERRGIEVAILRLVNTHQCPLIITTGGTGPSARDVTPEATRAVLEKELPGFGEIMRSESFSKVPTAILSRATAGIRSQSLIINLPGNPKAIRECLLPLLPAIAECIDHVAGFRPQIKV